MKNNLNNSMKTDGLTLVLGGTGKTGRRVAQRLEKLGVPTRVASRSANPAFDWDDQRTWAAALDGIASVYLSYAPDLAIPGATQSISTFVEKAEQYGVQRLVLLSGRGEAEAQLCEQIVRNSGIEWTIVRASWFNQNFSEGEFLGMVLDGQITLPASEVGEPFVDVDDIAEVAVAALTAPGHAGQTYELTGPRLLTFAEAAQEISNACDRPVRFVQISHRVFSQEVAESGAPDEITWLLDYLFSTVLDGRNASLGDGVQRALGRKPKDFAEYARQVADSGTWNVSSSIQKAVGL